ncbi:TPA: hypothetical protein EYP26_02665 [Candidatus Bathyarchaeota archaeon]|nr:hypothetical protein [Candidatus Bathyarchaeota archaeon]
MVRLILVRPGLRSRIEPIPETQEQKIAQDLAKQLQQVLGEIFPGGVVVGGPAGRWDAIVDMQVTEEEYAKMGRPGINEMVRLEITKVGGEEA